MLKLPPALIFDLARHSLLPSRAQAGDFKSCVEGAFGEAFAAAFHLPYARKVWGVEPTELSSELARRRVIGQGGGASRLLRAMLGGRQFLHPAGGFGELAEAYRRELQALGGSLLLEHRVEAVRAKGDGWRVRVQGGAELDAELLVSTIPSTALLRFLDPRPPEELLAAANRIRFRGLRLLYLSVPRESIGEADAYYFPEPSCLASRASEPKQYQAPRAVTGRSVLCIEIPGSPGGEAWESSAEELAKRVAAELQATGLDLAGWSLARELKLPAAYPIQDRHFEATRPLIRGHLAGHLTPPLMVLGRQGVLAHDNTHHVLLQAKQLGCCVEADGRVDLCRYSELQDAWDAAVVED